jgi:hypothetical protein
MMAAALLMFGVTAQEQQAQDENSARRGGRNRGSRGDSGGGGFEQLREQIRKVDEQLKEKFPEEYKELEKLDASDRRAAFQKRSELAKKAGIEMPEFGPRRNGGGDRRPDAAAAEQNAQEEWRKAEEAVKEKFPAEFAEYEKLRESDAPAALAKFRELAEKAGVKLPENQPKIIGPRNIARLAVAFADRILQQRYPEEYAEIVTLREEDPDLARDKYRELFKRAGLNSEDIKKRIEARSASTRIVQVEVPQNNNTNTNTGNSNRRWGGGMGGMGGMGGGGMGGPPGW